MPLTCCVPQCKSSARRQPTDVKISFHEFPVTDIRESWIKAISREGPNKTLWQPTETAKVCSMHFRPEDYKEGAKTRILKRNAVPSVFPNYPAYMQRTAERIRAEAMNQTQRPHVRKFEPSGASAQPPSKKPAISKNSTSPEKAASSSENTPTKKNSGTVTRAGCAKTVPQCKQGSKPPGGPFVQKAPDSFCVSVSSGAVVADNDEVEFEEELSIVMEEDSISSEHDIPECLDKQRTLGSQTLVTGVTLSALWDEIRLLKQRCSSLQRQLNEAHGENYALRVKMRFIQDLGAKGHNT
ncbi:uncharacterized protein LOC144169329 [Haemaphysalis longicornis]